MENQKYTSTSEMKGDYVKIAEIASRKKYVFDNFKRDKNYTGILEHVSQQQGQMYLNELKDSLVLENISKFKINDKLGNPNTFTYGDYGNLSPTTLRYIKVLQDIKNSYSIDDRNIIEIGCGYGGQYTVLSQIFKPKKYTFVDLPEVLSLIEKYLTTLNIKGNFEFINGKDDTMEYDKEYDLIISNYAISECNKDVQKYYIENILSKSKHGYITHNQFNGYTLNEFVDIIKSFGNEVVVTKESPLTGKNNVIIKW
tara:strand:- start:2020 stop:2784 length:765 start_codon:yes stop_codon:yes gene_type:complete